MSAYYKWNQAVTDFLFNKEKQQQPVFLYLDHELLDGIGEAHGLGNHEDFLEAVVKGPIQLGFPHYLDTLIRSWRKEGSQSEEVPPLIAPALISVLAWTERSDSEKSYYGALAAYLENLGIAFSEGELLRKLLLLFRLIERWCMAQKGVLGILKLGKLNGYRYVGQVHYHGLIKPEERRRLDRVWCDSGLKAKEDLSGEFLVNCVLNHSQVGAWLPTLKRYFTHYRSEIRLVAQEIVLLDYREWDGVSSWDPPQAPDPFDIPIQLRLCHLDSGQWTYRMYHARYRGVFRFEIGEIALKGEIGHHGWSDWLKMCDSGEEWQPGCLDCISGTRIPAEPAGEIQLSNDPIRILLPAHLLGLVGVEMVEQPTLISGSSFEILYHTSGQAKVVAWKEENGGKHLVFSDDEFPDWNLVKGSSARLKLNLSPLERFQGERSGNPFRGGKKIGPGVYFLYGLPEIKSEAAFISLGRIDGAGQTGLKLLPRENETDLYGLIIEPGYSAGPLGDDYILQVGEDQWTLQVRDPIPIPAFPKGMSWSYDQLGNLVTKGRDATHPFFLQSEEHLRCPPPNSTPFTGSAIPLVSGCEFMAQLLLVANEDQTLPFSALYKVMQKFAKESIGRELETPERGRSRKKLAALGCFIEDPSRSLLQLGPAVMVFLPRNHVSQRVLLVGTWLPAMLEVVRLWCEEMTNMTQMCWIFQEEPYLPPLVQLAFQKVEQIDALLGCLKGKFGNRTLLDAYPSYSERLFRWLAPAEWEPHPSLRSYFPVEAERLVPDVYAFMYVDATPIFPVLTRERVPRLGYHKYFWWESEDQGYECSGKMAPWKWMHERKLPIFFKDFRRSSTIYLPHFPLPAVVERGLTLSSGQACKTVHTIWEDETIVLQQFDQITPALRKELPRLLLGEIARSDPQTYFQPLKYTYQPTVHNGEIIK